MIFLLQASIYCLKMRIEPSNAQIELINSPKLTDILTEPEKRVDSVLEGLCSLLNYRFFDLSIKKSEFSSFILISTASFDNHKSIKKIIITILKKSKINSKFCVTLNIQKKKIIMNVMMISKKNYLIIFILENHKLTIKHKEQRLKIQTSP